MIRPLIEPQYVLEDAADRDPAEVFVTVTKLHALHHAAQWPRVLTACVLRPWTAWAVWIDSTLRHYEDAANATESVRRALLRRR